MSGRFFYPWGFIGEFSISLIETWGAPKGVGWAVGARTGPSIGRLGFTREFALPVFGNQGGNGAELSQRRLPRIHVG